MALLVIASTVFISTVTVEVNESYQMLLKHVRSNTKFRVLNSASTSTGLWNYFKEIRQPFCMKLKCIAQSCKFNKNNSISPSQTYSGCPVQNAWMWSKQYTHNWKNCYYTHACSLIHNYIHMYIPRWLCMQMVKLINRI